MATDSPVLIAYDGSEDAERAIDHAGAILPSGPAVVLTVWEPLVVSISRHGWGRSLMPNDAAELDDKSEEQAAQLAQAGVALAERAGFAATGRSVADTRDIAGAINAVAQDVDAALIVTGARGLEGFRAHLLGSVSRELAHTSDRPVLVVPPPQRSAKGSQEDATKVGDAAGSDAG